MHPPQLMVKYHNERMLKTVDLHQMTLTFLEKFGERFSVEFRPMDDLEKENSSHILEDIDGIVVVDDRFYVFEIDDEKGLLRRQDLEEEIVRLGRA